jgi:hypothetical protein
MKNNVTSFRRLDVSFSARIGYNSGAVEIRSGQIGTGSGFCTSALLSAWKSSFHQRYIQFYQQPSAAFSSAAAGPASMLTYLII